jgi:serine/threonine protein kinase/tetratricopeptide (TPR) repeat protein
MIGQRFGKYEVMEKIGAGGFGSVYKARDVESDSIVALKILKSEEAADTVVERFFREAKTASLLESPHIVEIYDSGTYDDGHFLAMELLEGLTLKDLAAKKKPSLEEVIRIAIQVCDALTVAHEKGIVHRDIKCENIMVDESGHTKVLDFGIARMSDMATLTRTGDVLGTAAYMSPEQALGDSLDGRSDIFSLGVVLYEMLTSVLPFPGEHPMAVLYSLINEDPRSMTELNSDLPIEAEHLLSKAMMKEPDKRYATAEEMKQDLAALLEKVEAGEREIDVVLKATVDREKVERPLFHPELIGREEEFKTLVELFQQSSSGTGKVAVVTGEAGIGKSRLVSELQKHAKSKVAMNLVGRCSTDAAGFPYQPFVEGVRNFLRSRDIKSQEDLEIFIQENCPELTERTGMLSTFLRMTKGPATESFRVEQMWDSFMLLLDSLGKLRPLTFLVEDLHWADEPTLELFSYLARRVTATRIMLLGTVRPEETNEEKGKLRETLSGLSRDESFVSIRLKRLKKEDVSEIIGSVLDQDLSVALTDRLWEQTEGNPLFILEALKLLASEGVLERCEEAWTLKEEIPQQVFTERVQDLVDMRLSRLSDEEKEILEVAAVEGISFHSEVVLNCLGLRKIQLLKQLQLLEKKHHIVRAVEKAYRFDHAVIRETLYASLIPELRSAYHLAVAEALEQSFGDIPGYAAAIGTHYSLGEEEVRSIPFFNRAAYEAKNVFANAQAVNYFSSALEALASVPEDEKSEELCDQEIVIRLGLAETLNLLGRYEEAEAEFKQAKSLGQAMQSPKRIAQGILGVGLSLHGRGEFEKAFDFYNEASELFAGCGDLANVAECMDRMGNILTKRGEYKNALEHHKKALEARKQCGDVIGQTTSLNNISTIYQNWGKYSDAFASLQEALQLAAKAEDKRKEALMRINLGIFHYLQGQMDEALENYERSLEVLRRIGDVWYVGLTLLNMGAVFLLRDQFDRALDCYYESLEISESIGDKWGKAGAMNNIALINLKRGVFDKAIEMLDKSLAIKEEIGDMRGVIESRSNLADLYLQLGCPDEAEKHLAKSLAVAEKSGDSLRAADTKASLGIVSLRRKDADRAKELFSQASSEVTESQSASAHLTVSRGLAQMALKEGEPETAVENARRAVEIAIDRKATYELGKARILLARSLLASGKPDDAEKAIMEAEDTIKDRGYRVIELETLTTRAEIFAASGRKLEAGELVGSAWDLYVQIKSSVPAMCSDLFDKSPLVEAISRVEEALD